MRPQNKQKPFGQLSYFCYTSHEILSHLTPQDEIKFVIGNIDDYEWTKKKIDKYNMTNKWSVLISPVFDKMSLEKLSSWILNDNLAVRLQLQMHKYIWDPDKTGV